MKKLFLFFLLVPFLTFGQLTRTLQLNGTALQYADKNPKSVVIILYGTGERGLAPDALEAKIQFINDLKTGKLTPAGRVIIIPQLATGQPGWYANTVDGVVAYAKTFKLPIDIAGYSLGGIGVGDNVPNYPASDKPTIFRSAATSCGRVDFSNAKMVPAFRSIPSIHYYDPSDNTVQYGYGSILSLVNQLLGEGKQDISLVTLKGSPTAHEIWNQVFAANNYWSWLNGLDGMVNPPTPAPTHLYVNGVDLGVWSAPINKVEIK